MATITVPARFNGPPDSGNGGYSAGLFAAALGARPAEVTLRAPVPIERELTIAPEGDGIAVRDGETLVAEARPAEVEADPPAPVPIDEAAAAATRGPFADAARHPFPSCFVCGPARREHDGLEILAGPVGEPGAGLFAAPWTPDVGFAGDDGHVGDPFVWAALDCPTSAPVANDAAAPGFKPIVLAKLAVRVDRPVIAGQPHLVMAWPLSVDGRKRRAAAALFDSDGAVCAVSSALWIELR